MKLSAMTLALLASVSSVGLEAQAAAIHDAGLFTDHTLAANDDGSTGLVNIGFTLNFFGASYSQLYVNNNGNVTFDDTLGTFTPFNLLTTATPMLAPFFADVDTRGSLSSKVQYGQDTLDGRNVFGVNWINVGYYNAQSDKLNSFQLIIHDRSDIGVGDFDFEFNYDRILWETGSASGGSGGFGGSSARAGWSNGVSASHEITGSAVNGALLDSNAATGLVHNSLSSPVEGRYLFQVRNGQVQDPNPIPEPGTLALLGLGLAGVFGLRRKQAA